MSSGTVWDAPEWVATPPPEPVTGRVDPPHSGGAAPEGAGLNFGVFAELAVRLGSLASKMDASMREWDRHTRSQPGDHQTARAGAYPSSGNLLLDLGHPDEGLYWQVRRLVVGGSDITTQPNGTAWVVVQGSPPNAAGSNVNLAQVADFTTEQFPQRAFYGTHQLVVDATEHLYVVITGGSSGTVYVASAKYEVFDLSQSATVDIE